MSENDLQERLVNGFSRFGYELTKGGGLYFEFGKKGNDLRLAVKGAEGGIMLFVTRLPEYNLSDTRAVFKNQENIDIMVFRDGPEEFWQAVKNIINSSN